VFPINVRFRIRGSKQRLDCIDFRKRMLTEETRSSVECRLTLIAVTTSAKTAANFIPCSNAVVLDSTKVLYNTHTVSLS